MQVAAFVLSIVALLVSLLTGTRQLILTRQANSIRLLVDMFKEHRDEHLAAARHFVFSELSDYDVKDGLASLPEDKRQLVRDLSWYYDNIGALVVHNVVDIEPVSGYLGGALTEVWQKMCPLVEAERNKRAAAGFIDPDRPQAYFEILYERVQHCPPSTARTRGRRRLARKPSPWVAPERRRSGRNR